MSILQWILLGLGIYIAIGVAFAVLLSQTPYADNGALINGLLWPVYLVAFITGRG